MEQYTVTQKEGYNEEKILNNATPKQNTAISETMDYLIHVYMKQGRMIEPKILFGDGSRWKPLNYKGFLAVYESIYKSVEELTKGMK